MILLIDNYDSFSYNLYQLVGSLNPDIRVIRNNEKSIREIEEMAPDRIILSPGPGRPENAGVCEDVVRQLAGKNAHHILEGQFKSAARSLRTAVSIDPELAGEIPSTKGVL